MTYTLNEVPEELDKALRERAKTEGKTFDQVAIEALAAYARESSIKPRRDLSFLGNLSVEDARLIEEAHEFCDRIGLASDSAK